MHGEVVILEQHSGEIYILCNQMFMSTCNLPEGVAPGDEGVDTGDGGDGVAGDGGDGVAGDGDGVAEDPESKLTSERPETSLHVTILVTSV